MALSRLVIGTAWTTGANVDVATPRTVAVGDDVVGQLRMLRLERAQLAQQQVVLGVGQFRRVVLVVQPVVVRDQLAQLPRSAPWSESATPSPAEQRAWRRWHRCGRPGRCRAAMSEIRSATGTPCDPSPHSGGEQALLTQP